MDSDTQDVETTVTKAPKPKKKAKARHKAAPRAAADPVEKTIPADGIYAGMTVTDCSDGCNANGCVISGRPYCAHPRKGGLHAPQMGDPAALKRLNHSKRILGKQMLDARSGE